MNNLPIGSTDNSDACRFMAEFTYALSELPQDEKIYYMRQTILGLMDFTEQSGDEHLWCDLLVEFNKLVDIYNKI